MHQLEAVLVALHRWRQILRPAQLVELSPNGAQHRERRYVQHRQQAKLVQLGCKLPPVPPRFC
jgi:hypothetical protein